MSVDELLDRVSSRELAEWGQYYEILAWERENGKSASGMYAPDVPPIETLIED